MRILLTALTALCVSATTAYGQWSQVGGDFEVTFDYKTTGSFGCILQHYAVERCESVGTTMKVWHHDAFAAFSFTGLTGTMTAANHGVGPIHFGTMHVRIGGAGPFTWPTMVAKTIPSFAMNVQLHTLNAPFNQTTGIGFKYLWGSPSFMHAFLGEGRGNYASMGLPSPQPSFLNYREVVFDNFLMPHIGTATDGDYEVYASTVSLIPEPTTYALTALGLVVVGMVARRRNR